MYTPRQNREEDAERLYAFMKAHNFAILVTATADGVPRATHLPFMVHMEENRFMLLAHMAKANPQWRDFSGGREVLVIFREPHAYVSPGHYETVENVPTWDYVAVHLYGRANILEASEDKLSLLEAMIGEHDEGFLKKWKELPDDYIEAQLSGIVAFRIVETRRDARFKLSQERTAGERRNIIEHFAASDESNVKELGELMREQEAR